MQLFDTHCHLDLEAFANDRDTVLASARSQGVQDILVPGVERRTWSELAAFCATDNNLHLALGLHPVFLAAHGVKDVEALSQAVETWHPIAIGEIGLDWQIRSLDRDKQQRLLEEQLVVAETFSLPVVLHVRKAHDAMLATLKRYRLPGGFCHAFNGSQQQAEQYLQLGFRLGFGGMLTYERSTHLRRLAAALPAEAIVLETDAPDMTVASHRYQRNSPAYLPEVLSALAAVRQTDAETLADVTTQNAFTILGLG